MNTVLEEVKAAYADCNMTGGDAFAIRQLEFKASEPVPHDEAQMIARSAIGEYNAFTPELLDLFPPDCRITFARENSVCLYVTPGATSLPTQDALGCDEYDYEDGGILRVWWD